jgi:ParB-like chromosome segregation protein Spo0J
MTRKKDIRPRRTIMRLNVRRPEDTGETIDALERRLAVTGAPVLPEGSDATVQIKREHIKVAEKVFQWRLQRHNRLPSDDHILNLARAINRGDQLPPILVFPIGQDFYVIDGHHRLAAYDSAEWSKAIPAKVFTGTLKEAERVALRSNNRDKLPLTREDRTEAAWRLVRQRDPQDSISSIIQDTGASKGSVNNMRSTLAKLIEQGDSPEDIQAMSWGKARWRAKGSHEDQEHGDWIEAEAQKLVDDILRFKLGTRLTKNSDVTALALAMLNPGLPEALMAEWAPEPAFDPHDKAPDLPF